MTDILDEQTPYYLEGLEWFVNEFRGLFPASKAYPHPFSENRVGCAYRGIQFIQMAGGSSLTMDDVARTARAANYFLTKGAEVHYNEVVGALFSIVESTTMHLNAMVDQRNAITRHINEDGGDPVFKEVLDYYRALYEGLSLHVLAPVVFAAQVLKSEKIQFPKDGKADVKFLHKMQKHRRPEDQLFLIGRNKYVRNAIAHERVELLDGDMVRLSEQDGRWSDEFTRQQMLDLCDNLWINSTAISLGHMIFYANNFHGARQSGLIPDDLPIPRSRDREEAIRHEAERWGFTVEKLECGPDSTVATLRTRKKEIPRPEIQISVDQSGRSARRYVDAQIISLSVKDGVREILLTVRRASESGGAYIRVIRYDGQEIANVPLLNVKSVSEAQIQSMNLGIPEEETTSVEQRQVR